MRLLLLAWIVSYSALAQEIDVSSIEFPWLNGGEKKTYRLSDHADSVFVFEAFQYS